MLQWTLILRHNSTWGRFFYYVVKEHYFHIVFVIFYPRKSSSDLVGLDLFQSPSNSDSSTPTIGAAGQSYNGSFVSPTATGSPSNRQNTATPG